MIPPKQRPIVASIITAMSLIPIAITGMFHGQIQGAKNEAELNRSNHLEAVSKAFMSENCYIVEDIVIGGEINIKGRSQSICIQLQNSSRFGFIEYQKGALITVDAFSQKEVQAKKSTLGVKK